MVDQNNSNVVNVFGNSRILAAIVAVALVAAAGGAYIAIAVQDARTQRTASVFETLEPFIVNLDEPGGNRYLKMGLRIETRRSFAKLQKQRTVKFRDAVIVYLSGLRVADVQRVESKKKMKKTLLQLASDAYGSGIVFGIYFDEFVIQ